MIFIYNYLFTPINTQIHNQNIIYTHTLYYILDIKNNIPIYDEYIVIQNNNNDYIYI